MKETFTLDSKVLVFFDVQFYHGSQLLSAQISSDFPNIIFTYIKTHVQVAQTDDQTSENDRKHTFCGRTFEIAEDSKIHDYSLLYIGGESATLTNLLMHYNQLPMWTFNPIGDVFRKETVNANRALMKRFYLIERAKDADIIGIVVGTLAVSNYMDILAYLKRIIKAAGKKYYTFVMGKLNIPKLANFSEIDMFVLVACPENSLLDSKEFFRPIVTPFEMEIALVKGKEWTNTYSADFAEVLRSKDLKQLESEIYNDGSESTEAEDVRISLVSNKVRVNHKALAVTSEEESDQPGDRRAGSESSNALTRRENLDVALTSVPTASTVFLQRSFQGLQQRLGEDAPHVATEGRAGIASGYDQEGH
jgi:diphthamide biosynthesis protein 2